MFLDFLEGLLAQVMLDLAGVRSRRFLADSQLNEEVDPNKLPPAVCKKREYIAGIDNSKPGQYNNSCSLRSWRNRQTRTFEGRMGDRMGSSPIDRTKEKAR